MRVVKHRNRLPRAAVDVFKARLNGILSNTEGVCTHGRGVELDDL